MLDTLKQADRASTLRLPEWIRCRHVSVGKVVSCCCLCMNATVHAVRDDDDDNMLLDIVTGLVLKVMILSDL